MALSSGTIDGIVFGGPAAYYDMKLFEVGKYMYDPPFNAGYALNMVANQRVWDSLPDDLKAIFDSVAESTMIYSDTIWLNSEKDYYYYLREQLQVNELTPEATAKFREAAKPVWQSYVDDGFFTWADIDEAMRIAKN